MNTIYAWLLKASITIHFTGRNPDDKTETNHAAQPFHLEATKEYCLGDEREDSDSSDSQSLLVGLTPLPTEDDDMSATFQLETTKAYCPGNEKEDSDSSDSQSLLVGLTPLPTEDDDMSGTFHLETTKAYCPGNEEQDSDSSDSQSLLVGLTPLPTEDDDMSATFHLETAKAYCLGNEKEDSDSSDSQSLLVGLTPLPTEDDDMPILDSDNERENGKGFYFSGKWQPIQAYGNGASDDNDDDDDDGGGGGGDDNDEDHGDNDEREEGYIDTVEKQSFKTFGMNDGKDTLQSTTPQELEETKGCEGDEPDDKNFDSPGSGSTDRHQARSNEEPSDGDVQAQELVRKLVSLILIFVKEVQVA